MCAGRGTRLRPITDTIPKPLVPVAGKTLLEYILDALPEEVDRIILVIGYLGEKIRTHIGSEHRGRPIVYVEHEQLDGTGGVMRVVEPHLLSDRFMVLYGDNLYVAEDLTALVKHPSSVLYISSRIFGTMDAFMVDESGRLSGLHRPAPGSMACINTGAYVLTRNWYATDPTPVPGKADEWSLPHALPQLIENGEEIHAIETHFWLSVGTLEELEEAEKRLKDQGNN